MARRCRATRGRSRWRPRSRRTRSGQSRHGSRRRGRRRPRSGRTRRSTSRRAAARTRLAPRAPRPRRRPRRALAARPRPDGPPAPRRSRRRRRRRGPEQPARPAALGWIRSLWAPPRGGRRTLAVDVRVVRGRPLAILNALLVDHLLVEREALVMEEMAELLLLRAQVGDVVLVGGVLDRHLVGDPEPVALESDDLLWVVREQADRAEPEVDEDL